MQSNKNIENLQIAVVTFTDFIMNMPQDKFLELIDEWTPRDVVAHLIGWNRQTISCCSDIRLGKLPDVFEDDKNDYSNINAEFVRLYEFTDRQLLLDKLEDSAHALENYLLFLNPQDWEADFGVRLDDSTITIQNTVEALIKDYYDHRDQISSWLSA